MKPALHPDYHPITVVMTDGTEYQSYSTWGKAGDVMRLEIDPTAHPAWTGGTQKIMEKGQLSKFEKRFGNFGATGAKKEDKKEDKEGKGK